MTGFIAFTHYIKLIKFMQLKRASVVFNVITSILIFYFSNFTFKGKF